MSFVGAHDSYSVGVNNCEQANLKAFRAIPEAYTDHPLY